MSARRSQEWDELLVWVIHPAGIRRDGGRVSKPHGRRELATTVLAVLVAATAAAVARPSSTDPVPFLAPSPALSIDRDLPPSVRDRYEREQRRRVELARNAIAAPATRAAGCVRSGTSALGPPAPTVAARVLGHHVEVVFEFARLPASLACRPWEVTVVVFAGRQASASYKSQVASFLVSESRARVVVDLPWFAQPPYSLGVTSSTILGRRGRAVERRLRCPGTGHAVRGCLPGYRPGLHSFPMPRPVLPVRGLTSGTLENSLRYVVAGERNLPALNAVPIASECRSLERCDVTYADPSFPAAQYRVRYRIAGAQVRGCWMGIREAVLGAMPYEDAGRGRLQLAGCASWR